MLLADKAFVPPADEFVVRFEEIFTLPHAVRMVGLVAVPVVAEAEVAAVLADEAEVALPLGLLLGLFRLRLRLPPIRAGAAAGLGGRPPALPLPHRRRDGRRGGVARDSGCGGWRSK